MLKCIKLNIIKLKSQIFRFFKLVFALISGLVGTALLNLFSLMQNNREFITNLSNAWFVSSLLLLLFKIFFFSFSFKINLLLLLLLTFFSYIYFWYLILQYFFILILRKIMPESIQSYRDTVWENLILEAEDFPHKEAEFEKKSKISFFQHVILNIYIYFVFLRMFLIQNPFLYLFIYFIIYFCLLATNNYFFLYIVSFIILISKLCFFLCCDTVNEYKACMHCFSNRDFPYKIKTTKKNAIIFSYFNLSLLCNSKYFIFSFKNELDIPFINILIVDHFLILRVQKTAIKCEIEIKE